MPGEFKLSRNVRFYSAEEVSDGHITAVLEAAAEDSVEVFHDFSVFRQEVPALDYTYSASVFLIERDVHFHSDPALKDRIYGYIAIIEIDGYLVVLKKNSGDLTEVLDEKFEKLGYEHLAASVDTDTAEFRKINVRSMTVSERAIRSRSYEALDLKGVMSLHAAGRSIPSYLRVQDGASTKSVTLGAARLMEFSDRQSIDEIAAWVRSELARMSQGAPENGFLSNFARTADLTEVEAQLGKKPRSLLVEASVLQDKIETGSLRLVIEKKNGGVAEVRGAARIALLRQISEVYEFDDDGKIVGFEQDAWLKGSPGRKTLTFHARSLQRVRVVGEGVSATTLQSFIQKNGAYAICFDDPQFMYFAKRCFKDVSGSAEIDSLLGIFVEQSKMRGVTSEKGSYGSHKTRFDADSIFGAVESIHHADDFVFCDDMGNEWADHIAFSRANQAVTFIHSKHGAVSASASALHEVVGQAIKNLGNMHFSVDQMVAKYDRSLKGKVMKGTRISRVRKRNGQFPAYVKSLVSSYGFDRVCVLACSFVSLSHISRELKKIKAGVPVSGNITQFYWIVSSFAHACRDMGVVPKIYCVP